MAWLNKYVCTTPEWLLDKRVLAKTGLTPDNIIRTTQIAILDKFFNNDMINRLTLASVQEGAAAYSPVEFFTDLKKMIWSELAANKSVDLYRRNLQKEYINRLEQTLEKGNKGSTPVNSLQNAVVGILNKNNDGFSALLAITKLLRTELRVAAPAAKDKMTRYHYEDMIRRLDAMLDPK